MVDRIWFRISVSIVFLLTSKGEPKKASVSVNTVWDPEYEFIKAIKVGSES